LPVPPIAEGQSGNIRNTLNQLLMSQDPQVAAAIRSGIEARIDALKAALTNQIASLVTKPLNRTYFFYDSWADPLIGLRGRLNLNKVFYLTGETDVGGFGIGSDIALQAYAGLGCELTRNIFSEVGYRFLYDDFGDESVGYLYQLSTRGAQLKVGLRF
jgi:opacity protein-like surface antigen